MINLSLSLTKSLSYTTIIWVLFVTPSCVLSVDERHRHCTPLFKCGDQTGLYYPFWTADREECGHPDFKVTCSGGFAEFSISSVTFRILEMTYESHIIRLARMDYLNNLCPQYPESATINQDVLPFYNDTELLTFFYDCPDPVVDVPPNDYIRQLNCEDGIGGQSYLVLPPSHSRNRAILDKCKTNFNIPVSRSALTTAERNHSLEAMKEALDQGFKLRFNSDCSRCVESMGACGYNHSSRAFVCYCKNEPHRHNCKKKGNDFFCSVSPNILADLS